MAARRDVHEVRELTIAGRKVDPGFSHPAVFRATYSMIPELGKWELEVVCLADPRINGTWYYDDRLVAYGSTRLAVDQLVGRWRRKRLKKVGRGRFKLVAQANRHPMSNAERKAAYDKRHATGE
jgi:hypothetical protein